MRVSNAHSMSGITNQSTALYIAMQQSERKTLGHQRSGGSKQSHEV